MKQGGSKSPPFLYVYFVRQQVIFKHTYLVMDNRGIVDEIARNGILDRIVNNITDNGKVAKDESSLDDLKQDIYISLLLDSKLPNIYKEGHIKFYITRIVMNNICSSSSPYYRIYLKPRMNMTTLNEGINKADE